jgi:uncharacterized protein YigE (DUF2233 family)
MSLTLVGCLASSISQTNNQATKTGLNIPLQEITINKKTYLIATIDPDIFQLTIFENNRAPDSLSIKQAKENTKSQLAFNGSFYDKEFMPLGLLISKGKLLYPLTKSQLMNGVLTINQKKTPSLYSSQEFQDKQSTLLPEIDFAIQAGPILLDNQGKIAVDKNNSKNAGRTAIGLDKEGKIILIMLRQTLLNHENTQTLYDFAQTISSSQEFTNLGLNSVINLDGGNSSGLAVTDKYFPELEKVQNIILVNQRT